MRLCITQSLYLLTLSCSAGSVAYQESKVYVGQTYDELAMRLFEATAATVTKITKLVSKAVALG